MLDSMQVACPQTCAKMSVKVKYSDGRPETLFSDIMQRFKRKAQTAGRDDKSSSTILIATILRDGSILTLNDTRLTERDANSKLVDVEKQLLYLITVCTLCLNRFRSACAVKG